MVYGFDKIKIIEQTVCEECGRELKVGMVGYKCGDPSSVILCHSCIVTEVNKNKSKQGGPI